MRAKRLLRLLPISARDILLKGLPRGCFDRDFVLGLFREGSVGAEIGVHEGDFSRRILQLVRPGRVHLIDPWTYEREEPYGSSLYGGSLGVDQGHMDERYERVTRRFEREVAAGRVLIHRQRSAEALEAFDDDSLDWIYIDGNHLYEHVARDLELSQRKVRPGGWIAGDDYGEGGWWQGGVQRAVDQVVANGACVLVEVRNRQYVLRNRPARP